MEKQAQVALEALYNEEKETLKEPDDNTHTDQVQLSCQLRVSRCRVGSKTSMLDAVLRYGQQHGTTFGG